MNILKFTIFGIVGGIILNALVFIKLWEWFIIPVFNVNSITIPQSIGLTLFLSYLTYKYENDDENKTTTDNKQIKKMLYVYYGKVFGRALGALLFGWIITLFM